MKRTQRIVAGALALAVTCGLGACNSSQGGRDSESSETVQQSAATTLVNELDIETDWNEMASIESVDSSNEVGTGKLYVSGQTAGTVKALCYYDLATTQPELAELLAQRYGGVIETEITQSGSAYFERLGVLIAAGDSPDIIRYDWMAYPHGVSQNMFTALDDWLDMDSPLWSDEKSVIESFNYLGKHYYYPSNVQTNFAMIYNRRVIEENAMTDPMELYFEGNWTWDTFEDMLVQWCNKGDDYVGFTGGSWSSMMFANTTGTKTIDMTGTEIINNLSSANVRRTMEWLSGLKHDGFVGDGFLDPSTALVDGKLLFLGMGLTWGFESAQQGMYNNQIDAEIVAVPFPRDPQADKYYLSSDSFGFLIPSGSKNIQGGIDWILCGRIYETDPEVVAATRAEKMYDGPNYYPKCPECKYNFIEHDQNDLGTCPECGTARKTKFKAVYSEDQMRIIDDMTDPEKFGLVFDNAVGFSNDFSNILIGVEDSIFDGPLYYGSSYTQVLETNNSLVEAYLEPYRDSLAKAASEMS